MAYQYSNVEHALLRDLRRGSTSLVKRIKKSNRIVLHNYQMTVTKTFKCPLPFCGKPFTVQLIPNQVVYPKYCEAHRTFHRRKHFLGSRFSMRGLKPGNRKE